LLKNAVNYDSLVFIYFPLTGLLDVAVTIDTFASALRDLTGSGPFSLATHGPLGYLLPFYLSDESSGRQNESPDGGIFELLRDELELGADLLHLIEQDANMVLVSGEPVYGVGHYHVYGSLSEQKP
jgi:hypothetical protein